MRLSSRRGAPVLPSQETQRDSRRPLCFAERRGGRPRASRSSVFSLRGLVTQSLMILTNCKRSTSVLWMGLLRLREGGPPELETAAYLDSAPEMGDRTHDTLYPWGSHRCHRRDRSRGPGVGWSPSCASDSRVTLGQPVPCSGPQLLPLYNETPSNQCLCLLAAWTSRWLGPWELPCPCGEQ